MPEIVPDFKTMKPEEVQEFLQKRRAELAANIQAAKATGVKVEAEKKRPPDDKDKLEWLFDRLGYQTGMRWWAQGRMDELQGRIEEVLKVSELSPTRVGALLKEAAEGFRKARIGTSFESTSMPDKKTAENVPTSEVFQELLTKWQTTYGPAPTFLTRFIEGVEVQEAPPAVPSDREMFPKPTTSTQVDNEEGDDDGQRVNSGPEPSGEPAGGSDGAAQLAAGPDALHDGPGDLGPVGPDAGDHVEDQPTRRGRRNK